MVARMDRRFGVPKRSAAGRWSRPGHTIQDGRQAALPFEQAPPLDRHGLFFAALLDHALRMTCVAYGRHARRGGGFRGRLVPEDRLHVTLFWAGFLRSLPLEAVACLAQILDRFPFEPMEIVLDELVSTGTHLLLRPSARSAEAEFFSRRMRTALGEMRWPWPVHHRFSPHVTIGHGDGRPFEHPIEPIFAEIVGMRLLHSRHGEGVHRHPVGGPEGPDIVLITGPRRNAARDGTLPSQASLLV